MGPRLDWLLCGFPPSRALRAKRPPNAWGPKGPIFACPGPSFGRVLAGFGRFSCFGALWGPLGPFLAPAGPCGPKTREPAPLALRVLSVLGLRPLWGPKGPLFGPLWGPKPVQQPLAPFCAVRGWFCLFSALFGPLSPLLAGSLPDIPAFWGPKTRVFGRYRPKRGDKQRCSGPLFCFSPPGLRPGAQTWQNQEGPGPSGPEMLVFRGFRFLVPGL